jgi:hypothetical protein
MFGGITQSRAECFEEHEAQNPVPNPHLATTTSSGLWQWRDDASTEFYL